MTGAGSERPRCRWPWIAVLVVLLVTSTIRVRLLDVPLERDEGEYAYAGQLMLQGVPPYRAAYNMKLPGTYAAYAVAMAVFGQTVRGIHAGLLVVNAASAILVFLIGRRMLGARAGAMAAAAFGALSLSHGVFGVFAHATHFVLLPALGGVLLLTRALGFPGAPASEAPPGAPEPRSPARPLLLGSGALLGLACVMKQHGGAFALFGAAWLAWELRARGARAGRVAIAEAAFLIGAAMPFALTCAVLAWAGVFDAFWLWTFDYARAYAGAVSLAEGVQALGEGMARVAGTTLPLWLLAGAGLVLAAFDVRWRAGRRFALSLAAASALAVCPGLYFRAHYFVLALPAVALLAALAATAIAEHLADRLARGGAGSGGRAGGLAWLVLGIGLAYPAVREREYLLTMPPDAVARRTFGPNPFPEALEIARRIAADSSPADRVAVLGSEPEIYFYARRRSATGHIYMYALMERHRHAAAMQRQAIREIESTAPRYVVFVDVVYSWLRRPDSDPTLLQWMNAYLGRHYEVVGVADIVSQTETRYVWGAPARAYTARSPYAVYLLRRLDGSR